MQLHPFGSLFPVSTLTLGGGGLGMLWGKTTFEECVATVHDAVKAGINLLDLAPRYGDGKAERVVGEAFGGRVPAGVRITSKCNLGNPAPGKVLSVFRQSIESSLRLLQRDRLDIFFLHSNVAPDGHPMWNAPDVSRLTPLSLYRSHVRDAMEKLKEEGLIAAWGLTGIGHPDAIIQVLAEAPKPAAVQCIANLLDSPGGLKFYADPAKPRAVMAAARTNGVGIMGIRAVQAGALTAAIDRDLPPDHPEVLDYRKAAGFRAICAEIGADPAIVAHRYALGLDIDTLVLGVKNRAELTGCIAAAEAGPLPPDLVARIDASVAG
ncbi:MAG TPA: aldo/keto reductase [Rhodopila sp.]|uniref:aldo/keto reductase n=1 Tax=Rhodopila sp. TaxID=2480087 RepID=UPI002BCC2282|nr:aldo/keto reductase [Rhodopila sp.]HVY14248.1 aldo/keto reductase [Rhodopila sp.]